MPNKAYWDVVKSLKNYPENWSRGDYRLVNYSTTIWIANGPPFLEIRESDKLSWNGGLLALFNPFNFYLAYLISKHYAPVNLKENL
jgi:hypothetical protein